MSKKNNKRRIVKIRSMDSRLLLSLVFLTVIASGCVGQNQETDRKPSKNIDLSQYESKLAESSFQVTYENSRMMRKTVSVSQGRISSINSTGINSDTGSYNFLYRPSKEKDSGTEYLWCLESGKNCRYYSDGFETSTPIFIEDTTGIELSKIGSKSVKGRECARYRFTSVEPEIFGKGMKNKLGRYGKINATACLDEKKGFILSLTATAETRYGKTEYSYKAVEFQGEVTRAQPPAAAINLNCEQRTGEVAVFTNPAEVKIKLKASDGSTVGTTKVELSQPWENKQISGLTFPDSSFMAVPYINGEKIKEGASACLS